MSKLEIINQSTRIDNTLYIMYNALRLSQNEAIEYAKEFSSFDIVVFHFNEQNERQNKFFLDGVRNIKDIEMDKLGSINLVSDFKGLLNITNKYSQIVIDQPYLNEHKTFVNKVFENNQEKMIVFVENQTVVPVKVVSLKEEYSARTIRPKIWRLFNEYHQVYQDNEMFNFEKEARTVLDDFIYSKLKFYNLKNDPTLDYVSKLSVYLKYGFLSVSYIYEKVKHLKNSDLFLEELIVRRELAYNFVYYNKGYDSFYKMTYKWAYDTMEQHWDDPKDYTYTINDYIEFKTHDPYFNQAMKNMVSNGYMHGYMRMYWCKKIIEWSNSFEEAFEIATYLNNYYFLDGNSPNGYAGVAWCFGKHDRAWFERPVFGKLRYMNQNGLKRKYKIENYIKGE